MSMIQDWPTAEEQTAAFARGCTCEVRDVGAFPGQENQIERDPYCVEHGDRMIMRATIDKLRAAIGAAVVRRFLS